MATNPQWAALGKFIFEKNPYPNAGMKLGTDWQLHVEIDELHNYWYFNGELKYVEKAMRIAYLYTIPKELPPRLQNRGINVDHVLIGYENNDHYGDEEIEEATDHAQDTLPLMWSSVEEQLGQFIFGQNPLTKKMKLDDDWEELGPDSNHNRWYFDGKARYVKEARRIPYSYPGIGKVHHAALLLGYQGGAGH
jgi:hypothetical protein